MMVETLAWQWEADSSAANNIAPVVAPFISNSDLWDLWLEISRNEVIHARTYSEIVKGSFIDPKTVMDEVLKVKQAHSRMEPVGRIMSEVKKTGAKLTLRQMDRSDPHARDVIMLFTTAMLGLERIQFMSSFPVTFAFAEADRFMNIGLAVQKIANDELNIHAVSDKEILRTELATAVGRESWSRVKSHAQELIDSIVKAELSWTKHLFRDGRQLPGCTEQTVTDGIHYAATDVYEFLGLDNHGKVIKKQPIEYMDDWTNLNKSQGSPQEHKTGNYLIGGVKSNLGSKVLVEDF
jgi:ribonucleoside-diphosphate reductase beta chain